MKIMSKQIKQKRKLDGKVLGRLIRMLFKFYPVMVPVTMVCIVLSAIVTALPAIFQQKVLAVVTGYLEAGNFDWTIAKTEVLPLVGVLIVLYILSIVLITIYSQIMTFITQGFLNKMRRKLFDGMQNLPIKFFDTYKHGDIMSYYTNDIDSLRQLISQSIPNLLRSAVIVISVLSIMLWYSLWMTLVVMLGVLVMILVSKKIGGGSAKYFIRQQGSIGKSEGYIQEMMNGQKVIKVFNHEERAIEEFNKINEELFQDSYKAHAYANSMGPIIMNIGNVLYVLCAIVGGLFLILGVNNISISGLVFSIDILVPFLNMTKQFTGNINQVSQQINSVVMAMAGAERVFSLMDQEPEVDEGYVTLVNCKYDNKGNIVETKERTHHWAWKHPHKDGTLTYKELQGDVRIDDVDFGYEPDKKVLHGISVYAEPGQKIAFVGATGAGKTTITNLLNRFYDIADGKIYYDGININKIKKSDLRRSLGIVLQETNLFTGKVIDNIRYGRLDATDEEVIEAAQLAHAHNFIQTLPEGYNMIINEEADNISQGQKQLLTIARAILSDPRILILDEATSSVDTRTEVLIQKAMENLMKERTSFIIAHRLSTIRDADLILVMKDGDIIEQGSHGELIKKKGFYAELYNSQFEREKVS